MQIYQDRYYYGTDERLNKVGSTGDWSHGSLIDGAHFVGFQEPSMKDKVMEYLMCLKQGLQHTDQDVSLSIQHIVLYELISQPNKHCRGVAIDRSVRYLRRSVDSQQTR